MNRQLKSIFRRERPPLLHRLVDESSFSFPSGHSVFATVFFATLALVLVDLIPRSRPWLRALAVLLCLTAAVLVAASRVWLGVHYPTDVIGGFLLGVGWVRLHLADPPRLAALARAPGLGRLTARPAADYGDPRAGRAGLSPQVPTLQKRRDEPRGTRQGSTGLQRRPRHVGRRQVDQRDVRPRRDRLHVRPGAGPGHPGDPREGAPHRRGRGDRRGRAQPLRRLLRLPLPDGRRPLRGEISRWPPPWAAP